jgi:signal transduction histidine kinase/CheY-like chemotaxis protein/AraC-like DNA-binding protein
LLDYNNPGNIIYEHRIGTGAWQQNQEGQNTLQLNHLQPGTYNIDVRALSAGAYSPVTSITIEVTPPWYRSSWAYLVYLIALIALIALIGLMLRRRANRRFEEAKMRFLINATHDIRSPLTIIMGAVGKLKNSKIEELKVESEFQSFNSSTFQPSLDTIDRNAQRLLQLVNQILDERRIDKKQLLLHCRPTDMGSFVGSICKLYEFTAKERGIAFTYENLTAPQSPKTAKLHEQVWIDRIQFDKVVSNLLSNAFKYTSDGGEVKVSLQETDNQVQIIVSDNGIGFKNENPERLFERFYQGRNAEDIGMHGTGIGLNLSRAITVMHGGQIKAANSPEGGAMFTVTLPKGNSHLKPGQIENVTPDESVMLSSALQKKTTGKSVSDADPAPSAQGNGHLQRQDAPSAAHRPAKDGSGSGSRHRILIADDEPEIGSYIISELGNRYRFDYVPNGREALKMLLTHKYDLVISDIMMPEMDGLALLKRIKENPQISQLPVILLTSKAEVEYKLEGLKGGADAYMAKPFDMEELQIQIDNLIGSVLRLKGKFSGAVSQEGRVENIEVKGNDEALMDRIMRSVNANMSSSDFNVDTLADDVGISRAQLHRKMKEMTGISTGRFLRNLRMEQAARLLREGKVNVSQVADRVGYADQAHFSTAFKNHFGQTPSEYAESHRD